MVVTDLSTTIQTATRQPTNAWPTWDNGNRLKLALTILATAKAMLNCTVLDLRLWSIKSITKVLHVRQLGFSEG